MAAVSVVVAAPHPELSGLLRSVDAQSLHTDRFELIVVDASPGGPTDRLRQLAGRRPNVAVLTATGADRAGRMRAALEGTTSDFVVALDGRGRLAPRAIELLLERAERTGADVVLGRAVTRDGTGSQALPDDADEIGIAPPDAARCVALVRRTLLTGAADAGAALLDLPELLRGAGSVAAVGRYACTVDGLTAPPVADLTVDSSAYRWEAGELHVTARVGSKDALRRAWLVAGTESAEVVVPAALTQADRGWEMAAALDPRTAEAGRPLGNGPWALRLRIARARGEATLPLPAGPARPAVIAGRPYTVRSMDGLVRLDAGATRSSVVGRVAAVRASIGESAHGSLLVLEQPDLHVHEAATLPARVLLDRFDLPAQLVCSEGRARVEAYVGSLAGTSAVAVLVGGGRPVPTGLRLRVSGTGVMTLDTAPRRAPVDVPSPRRTPLVQRLRRRLPDALEPAARRLVRVPALRDAYRRLLSR